jgi:hypothetical protein
MLGPGRLFGHGTKSSFPATDSHHGFGLAFSPEDLAVLLGQLIQFSICLWIRVCDYGGIIDYEVTPLLLSLSGVD